MTDLGRDSSDKGRLAPAAEHFDIHASVVFQLGESLITDSVQALVELVKNSYDADASYCKVTISTEKVVDQTSPFNGAIGSISVEDDGAGMRLDEIRRGWLTISNSGKREAKEKEETTPKGRTPLGDKGLGRLGTQRLGSNIEILTRASDSPVEQHLWFSWKDFVGKTRLSDVDIHREEVTPQHKSGTKLIISQLQDVTLWQGDNLRKLETDLSQLISPYKAVRDFTVLAVVDGKQLELLQIAEKLRHAAQLRYELLFDGALFRMKGKARLAYIKSENSQAQKGAFEQLVEPDAGNRFYAFLSKRPRFDEFSVKKVDDGGWFVEYSYARYLDEYPELARVDDKVANPGPFTGEVDYFDLGAQSAAAQTVFSRAADFRKVIGALSGIKVYRDGFGIRVPADWLNLGRQWTRAGSYYSLKPHNTLGYIAISAARNRQLEETTDREGFKSNAYYQNFYSVLSSFVEFSAGAQEFLRRGWLEFLKSHQRSVAKVAEDTKPETLSRKITSEVGRASQFRISLAQVSARLKMAIESGRKAFDSVPSEGLNGNRAALQGALDELAGVIQEAQKISKEVESYLQEVEGLQQLGRVLTNQINDLRQQIQQVFEVIALGLTAEALSHETENITSQLAQRNQQVIRYMRANNIVDRRITTFTEYVNTSVAGLRRQLSFLAPSLQYAREKRETIDMEDFVADTIKHYTTHFATSPIQILSRLNKGQNFKVEMNRGKLIQILDNLVLNSEYWLREDLRTGRLTLATITLMLSKPFLRVSDNGRGVEPALEASLFEPFVTAKPKGKGRGLGLYIVRQLLEAEGCTIRLMPLRNDQSRLYCFEMDLTGVLLDKR